MSLTGSLRADHAKAKMLGIPTVKGWRKKIRAIELTEAQESQVNKDVAARDNRVHLARLLRDPAKKTPFALHPEMEITGAVYCRLISEGFDAHLEVTVPSHAHVSGRMRVDIGVLERGQLVSVIECKRTGKGLSSHSRQAIAYEELRARYGVSLHFINRVSALDALISALRARALGTAP